MEVGDTVSLRVATPAGHADVVGTLLAASARVLTVRRRDGTVAQITVDTVVAGRVVPPGPARTVATGELERIAARGWQALETHPLGDWVLRASGGFTGRANSVLAVGEARQPLESAVAELTRWYAVRGLPPRVQLPSADAPEGLPAMLEAMGWTTSPTVHVMTAELGPVLRATASTEGSDGSDVSDVRVQLDEAPDDAWLAALRQESADRSDGALPPVARRVLVNHETVVFASVREAGACIAIARTAVDGRWAGLHCVEVAPGRRRQGLARLVSSAALRWAGTRGARHVYLQASVDNAPAVDLYGQLGFAVHHNYTYLSGRTRGDLSSTS